jgi:hypothetical protein
MSRRATSVEIYVFWALAPHRYFPLSLPHPYWIEESHVYQISFFTQRLKRCGYFYYRAGIHRR